MAIGCEQQQVMSSKLQHDQSDVENPYPTYYTLLYIFTGLQLIDRELRRGLKISKVPGCQD